MRPSAAVCLLLASIPSALGDVVFTSPAPGSPVVGGSTFTVTWKESGSAPAIVDLLSYNLFLFSGSNAAPFQLTSLKAASFAAGVVSATVTVPVSIGGPGTNAYFLGMLSVAKAGGTITNYSDRFTLSGMTGTFPPDVIASNKDVAGTAGPADLNQVAKPNQGAAGGAAGGAIDEGAWGTPYDEQVGPTRFAPMQPIPGTKITATNTKPLWPTSSVPLAHTFLPALGTKIVTTQTQPQTFSAQSHENTAAPQSQPADDMQKFLNRWKD